MLVASSALLAFVVTVFIVLQFSVDAPSSPTIRFWTPPAASQTFGVAFSPFFAQVVAPNGIGLAGVAVTISVYPATPIPLSVPLNGAMVLSRVIDCSSFWANPFQPYRQENEAMCDPAAHVPNGVVGNTAVTGSDGVAAFTGLLVNYGHPTSYTIVATHNAPLVPGDVTPNFVVTSTRFALGVDSNSLVTPFSAALDYDPANPAGIQIGTVANPTPGLPIFLYANFTVSDYVQQCGNGTAPSPILASVLSLNFGAVARQQGIVGLELADPDSTDNTITSTNTFAAGRCIFYDPVASVATIAFNFQNFSVTSAAAPKIFIGFYFAGAVLPLLFGGLHSNDLSPSTLLPPLVVGTPVTNVRVSAPSASMTLNNSLAQTLVQPDQRAKLQQFPQLGALYNASLFVMEATPLSLTATLQAAAARQPQGRRCYASSVASITSVLDFTARSASLSAANVPKTLLYTVSDPSDTTGAAAFQQLQFSSSGAPGFYNVTVGCDGVRSADFVVLVWSAVDASLASWVGVQDADSPATVIVSQPWPSMPSVRVVNSAGSPIPGKYASVDAPGMYVQSKSVPSNEDGWIAFESIVVSACFNAAIPTARVFTIFVDSIAIVQFRRVVQLPFASGTDPDAIANGTAGPPLYSGQCAVINTNSSSGPGSAAIWLSNVGYAVGISAFDLSGAPADATVSVTTSESTPLMVTGTGFGSSRTTQGPIAVYKGQSTTVVIGFTKITRQTFATLTVNCSGALFVGIVAVVPRIVHFSVGDSTLGFTLGDTTTLAEWPIAIQARLVALPRYIVDNFGIRSVASPFANMTNISVPVAIPQFQVKPLPGLFVVMVYADGIAAPTFAKSIVPVIADPTVTVVTSWSGVGYGGSGPCGTPVVVNTSTTVATTVQPATVLPSAQQPVLRLCNGTAPLTGYQVYAELVLLAGGSSSGNATILPQLWDATTVGASVLNPWGRPADLALGGVANFDGFQRGMTQPAYAAYSSYSDADGLVKFSALGFLGGLPNSAFTLRYVVTPAGLFPSSPGAFVYDPNPLLLPGNGGLSVTVTVPPSSQLASGVPTNMQVAVQRVDGGLVSVTAIYPVAGRSSDPDLPTDTNAMQLPMAFGVNNARIDIRGIAFPPTAPLGTYQVNVVAPGVNVPASLVTVTGSAFNIPVAIAPNLVVRVGQPFTAVVKVTLPNQLGLPGVRVSAQLQRGSRFTCNFPGLSPHVTPTWECVGCGCVSNPNRTITTITSNCFNYYGSTIYRPSSFLEPTTATGTTGPGGTVTLSGLIVAAAAPGSGYRLSLSVIDASSTTIAAAILTMTHLIGRNTREIPASILGNMPAFIQNAVKAGVGASSQLAQPSADNSVSSTLSSAADFVSNLNASTVARLVSNPFAALIASERGAGSGGDGTALGTSIDFSVIHDVAFVCIKSQPVLPPGSTPPPPGKPLSFAGPPAAVVRVIGANNTWLANRSVAVVVVESANPDELAGPSAVIDPRDSVQISDSNGLATFTALHITAAAPGTYKLVFIVDGVSSPASQPFTINPPTSVGLETTMKLVALASLVVLVPLFASNVPGSARWWPAPAAVLCLALAFVAGIIGDPHSFLYTQVSTQGTVPQAITNSVYIRAHFLAGCCTAVVCVVLLFAPFIAGFIHSRHRLAWFAGVNDERRAVRAYKYAKWLTTTRVKRLSPQEVLEWRIHDEAAHPSGIYKAKRAFAGFVNKVCCGRHVMHDPPATPLEVQLSSHPHPSREVDPPPLPEPPADTRWDDMPPKVFIVVGLSFVVWFIMVLVSCYYFDKVREILRIVLSFLALYTGASTGPVAAALASVSPASTQQLQVALVGAVTYLFNTPGGAQYAPLMNLVPIIQHVDINAVLGNVAQMAQSLQDHLLGMQVSATVCASIAIIATFVSLMQTVPQLLTDIRRGAATMRPRHAAGGVLMHRLAGANILDSDRYVGLHTMHSALQFLLTFVVVMIIYPCLFIPQIREATFHALQSIFTLGLASIFAFFCFSVFIVNNFFVHGLVILRNALYLPWCVLATLWFVFNAIFHTALRIVLSIVIVTLTFARVDLGVMPMPLLFLDLGHKAFYSMLTVHAHMANPLVWYAVAILFRDQHRRDERRRLVRQEGTPKGIDDAAKQPPAAAATATSSGVHHPAMSVWMPHIRNAVLVQEWVERGLPLAMFDADALVNGTTRNVTLGDNAAVEMKVQTRFAHGRTALVARRFWLAWILHQNPSLRSMRKHRLPRPAASGGAHTLSGDHHQHQHPSGGSPPPRDVEERKGDDCRAHEEKLLPSDGSNA